MEAYGAVSTYELLAGLTVNFECIVWVPRAVEHLLLGMDEAGGFFLNLREANYLVCGEFFPELVKFNAFLANKLATVTAETGRCCVFTFLTRTFLGLLEGVSDVKQVGNMEGGL